MFCDKGSFSFHVIHVRYENHTAELYSTHVMNLIMLASHCPALDSRWTHENDFFLISREVTPEDGNKIIFNRRLRDGCGRLHDYSRTIHGDNTKDKRS